MDEKLSHEEVLRIAKLARLDLTDDEVETYRFRLGRVLSYVRELDQVQLEEGFVRHVPRDAVSVRADMPVVFASPRSLLENAPSVEEHHFKLPSVFDSE